MYIYVYDGCLCVPTQTTLIELPSFRDMIQYYMTRTSFSAQSCKDENCKNDSNEWMFVNEKDIDAYIANRQKDDSLHKIIQHELMQSKGEHTENKPVTSKEDAEAKELLDKFQTFLNHTSLYDGINLRGNQSIMHEAMKLTDEARNRLRQTLSSRINANALNNSVGLEDLLEVFETLDEGYWEGNTSENSSSEGASVEFSDDSDISEASDTKQEEMVHRVVAV